MMSSEIIVANYLDELGIDWVHEFPTFVYDDKERPRVWAPDFYLPNVGVYIEVCGSKTFDYDYRKMVYRKNGIEVIFLHGYKEDYKWQNYLVSCLLEIEGQRMRLLNSVVDCVELQVENNLTMYN